MFEHTYNMNGLLLSFAYFCWNIEASYFFSLQNKLESYKTIEKSGKKLTSDQKVAVSKYDECLASLELTRELCKQFQSIAAVANREAKKEAKRVSRFFF